MLWMLLLQVVLIGLNALFACAEIAILSVNANKMEKLAAENNSAAQRVVQFLRQPERFLATIQVAITLSGFLGSAFAADNFAGSLADWIGRFNLPIAHDTLKSISVIVITLILSYFTLVFGELVPKRLAMRKTESLSLGMSGFLRAISIVFKPLVSFLSVSTNAVLRMLGIDPDQSEDQAGEEEILLMVDSGQIEPAEKDLINNVFDFDDLCADEIATHRRDVAFLDLEEPFSDWKKIIKDTNYSIYPVICGQEDEVIGTISIKDLLFSSNDPSREQIEALITPPLFVGQNQKADEVFNDLKSHRQKMAIVLDEYGGIVGIVTLQDVLEALVGDIEISETIEKIGVDLWQINGNVTIDAMEDALGLDLPDESNTVTGLVFDTLGRIPKHDEHITIPVGPYTLEVIEMDNRRVKRAIVERRAVNPKTEQKKKEDQE